MYEVVSKQIQISLSNLFISLPTGGEVCHLMIFANRLDPDQAWQNFCPDLDPIRLTLIVFLK